MTASDYSVINQTMKLIFTIKILKHSILKFMDSQSLISPLALFSSRYRLLVRSKLTWFPFTIGEMLRSCTIKLLARFPRIKLHDDGFDFFFQYFYLCRSSQSYGHDQCFFSSSLHSIP